MAIKSVVQIRVEALTRDSRCETEKERERARRRDRLGLWRKRRGRIKNSQFVVNAREREARDKSVFQPVKRLTWMKV
jgi:hypothetical protein